METKDIIIAAFNEDREENMAKLLESFYPKLGVDQATFTKNAMNWMIGEAGQTYFKKVCYSSTAKFHLLCEAASSAAFEMANPALAARFATEAVQEEREYNADRNNRNRSIKTYSRF